MGRKELSRLLAIVAAKIANSRVVLLRAARELADESRESALRETANRLSSAATEASHAASIDEARGHEGMAAQAYFSVFDQMIGGDREAFHFAGRTRRPSLDRVNAQLSFVYALLSHEVESSEPEIFGFLYVHPDRLCSAGIFVPSWMDEPSRTAYRYLQHYIQHLLLWKHLKNATLRSWGAKSLEESGKHGEPVLTGDGFARIGEGSSSTNLLTNSGVPRPGPQARSRQNPSLSCCVPRKSSCRKISPEPTRKSVAQARSSKERNRHCTHATASRKALSTV